MPKFTLATAIGVALIATSPAEALAGSCSNAKCTDVKLSRLRVYSDVNLIAFKIDTAVDTSYCVTDGGFIHVVPIFNQQELYKTLLTLFLTQKPAFMEFKLVSDTNVCQLRRLDLTTP